jgi:hypothetical protein
MSYLIPILKDVNWLMMSVWHSFRVPWTSLMSHFISKAAMVFALVSRSSEIDDFSERSFLSFSISMIRFWTSFSKSFLVVLRTPLMKSAVSSMSFFLLSYSLSTLSFMSPRS